MLSINIPPADRFLAPHVGDTLICLRQPRYAADCPPPLPLALIQAAGVMWWPDRAESTCLIVIWCASEMVADPRDALDKYQCIDWPGRIKITGQWRRLHGIPRIVTREEVEEAEESAINIPAWLERVQAEHLV